MNRATQYCESDGHTGVLLTEESKNRFGEKLYQRHLCVWSGNNYDIVCRLAGGGEAGSHIIIIK